MFFGLFVRYDTSLSGIIASLPLLTLSLWGIWTSCVIALLANKKGLLSAFLTNLVIIAVFATCHELIATSTEALNGTKTSYGSFFSDIYVKFWIFMGVYYSIFIFIFFYASLIRHARIRKTAYVVVLFVCTITSIYVEIFAYINFTPITLEILFSLPLHKIYDFIYSPLCFLISAATFYYWVDYRDDRLTFSQTLSRLRKTPKIFIKWQSDWGTRVPWIALPIIIFLLYAFSTGLDCKYFINNPKCDERIHLFALAGIVRVYPTLHEAIGNLSSTITLLWPFSVFLFIAWLAGKKGFARALLSNLALIILMAMCFAIAYGEAHYRNFETGYAFYLLITYKSFWNFIGAYLPPFIFVFFFISFINKARIRKIAYVVALPICIIFIPYFKHTLIFGYKFTDLESLTSLPQIEIALLIFTALCYLVSAINFYYWMDYKAEKNSRAT